MGRRHIIELDGAPIGEMNYRNKEGAAELGIKICDFAQQEKGYGTKLLTVFIDALFRHHGYERMILHTNLKNERAQHVYEKKLGFRRVGVDVDTWRDQLGEWQSAVNFEMRKADWLAAHAEPLGYTYDYDKLFGRWYAEVYERAIQEQEDVNYLLALLGTPPQKVLEIACGGGRIAVPLALAGHDVTGIDINPYMLDRTRARGADLPNLRVIEADAAQASWGEGFDAVVLGANLLINIESGMDYRASQRLFIEKAAKCLRTGGHLFLDFDVYPDDEPSSDSGGEYLIFGGEDAQGTNGRFTVFGGGFDAAARRMTGSRKFALQPKGGEPFTLYERMSKYAPHWREVEGWLQGAGFQTESLCGGYRGQPFTGGGRATVWARKA